MKKLLWVASLVPLLGTPVQAGVALFDGKTFAGWEGKTEQVWKVVDGTIVADASAQALPNNEFLVTEKRYGNFELKLKIHIEGTEGFINAGVQFRSERIKGSPEMVGYQADYGAGYDGALYDESRRGQLVKPTPEVQKQAMKPGEWNAMRVRAEGSHIRIWMNDVLTSEYTEKDPAITRTGRIGLQIHGGGKLKVRYKDIEIEELPADEAPAPDKAPAPGKGVSLFNGTSLDGWSGEGRELWSVRDGAIAFGGDDSAHRRENWLQTKDSFSSFDLRFKARTEGSVGTGVFFRAEVTPGKRIVGWQADIEPGLHGGLYREGPQRGMVSYPAKDLLERIAKRDGWNDYRVRAEGSRIRVWLNDQLVNDYTDNDPGRRSEGVIALEMSATGNGAAYFKDLEIERLPEPTGELAAGQKAIGPQNRLTDEIRPAPAEIFKEGKFSLLDGDTVVFTGPQCMVDEQRLGNLEALLAVRWKDRSPLFRHMSWEGDTVYRQNRMMEWGTWKENLDAANAGVVVSWFGQLEALDEYRGPADFEKAYAALLDSFAARTRRIVVIGPALFEKPESDRIRDNTGKNAVVRTHSEIARKLAKERGYVFVDLSDLMSRRSGTGRLTRDGMHFTDEGEREVAGWIAARLGVEPSASVKEDVRAAVAEKNHLWFNLWRCTNWAFAYGDRTTTAFAGSAGKWPKFSEELEKYLPLIQRADQAVQALAGSRPLPAPLPEPPPRNDPPAPTPDEEKSKFKVKEGFDVNLFADESNGVVKPLQMRWDGRGRLWVACSPSYPQLQPGEKGHDYILVLEDTNGDGKADKALRFAENLTMPMGLEFAPEDQGGGIYLCEGTALYHLADANHDDRADGKEVILSGFGTGDTHQDANSLRWGADGRLWFSQGYHIWSYVETPSGVVELSRSGLWRFDPATRRLDSFLNESGAGANCWGVAFDDYGQVFHASGADLAVWHTTPAIIPTLHPMGLKTDIAYTKTKSLTPEFIGGSHLPPDLNGVLMKSTYYSSEVSLFRLHDRGATFKSEDLGSLVSSDGREFRPLVSMMGPDGAIYICDWTNPVIGHYQASYRDPKRDSSHGRIWRVTAQGRPLVKRPELEGLSAEQLVGRLESPERWERDAAKSRLYRLPESKAIPACDQALARANDALLYELSGVYSAHGKPRPGLVARLARSEDFRRRAWSARLTGLWYEQLPDRLDLLSSLVADENPRVRMEAVAACSWIKGANAPDAMRIATLAMDKPLDPAIEHSLIQCIHAQAPAWRPALAAGKLEFGSRTAALARLVEVAGDGSSLPVVLRALEAEKQPFVREKFQAFVIRYGSQQDVEKVAAAAIASPNILDILADTFPKRRDVLAPAPIIDRLLDSSDEAARTAGCRLIAASGNAGGSASKLPTLIGDANAGIPLRREAMKALARIDRAAALAVLKPLWSSADSALRGGAMEAAVSFVPEEVAKQSVAFLPKCSTAEEAGALILPFLGLQDGPKILGAALTAAAVPGEPAKLALQWLTRVGRDDKPLVEALNRAAGIEGSRPAYSEALVKRLVAEAWSKGNASRGNAVFHLPVAACTSCHKVGPDGTSDLGPDLGAIGRAMSPESIVEAVIWPKRQVKEGYLLTSLFSQDGRQIQGYVTRESASEVALKDISSGKIQEVSKKDIKSRDDVGTLMPDGVADTLSDNQRIDLLRYLFDQGK